MKIKDIRIYRKDLALTRPYTISGRTIAAVENVFLEIELANGLVGYGAANPAPEVVGEGPQQTEVNLHSDFVQGLRGQDIRDFHRLIQGVRDAFPGLPGTQAAVDIALHDAFGKYLDWPVVALYGQYIEELPTSITIGIQSEADTLATGREYWAAGFRVFKVKMGESPELDIARVRRLREQHGPELTIRVDANQGYTLPDLQRFMRETESVGIELIEQPLPVGLETQLGALHPELRRRLCADESLKGPRAALELTREAPYGIFNIKLMKCGGITGAMEIATIARQADIELFWGCNDESIISITAALHAAFACPHTRYIDLDGSFDLGEDVIAGGFQLANGRLRPGPGAGLGFLPR